METLLRHRLAYPPPQPKFWWTGAMHQKKCHATGMSNGSCACGSCHAKSVSQGKKPNYAAEAATGHSFRQHLKLHPQAAHFS
eukprot:scaffold507109_cov31-Prasinocladus_malaysianus.AAC.1